MPHPCLSCGACCAQFRVGLPWSEAEPALGGRVPVALTEPLRAHELAMRGTSQARPRCIALDAEIGRRSRCTIHPQRPHACRDLVASWETGAPDAQCDKARMAHGLPVLQPGDWGTAAGATPAA
ncbi:MAG TPA: YkgJ family cysteine cluster protein [Xanthomonadaceae bacterium]|nr:YkgJ family cysteine cluster protein [Xanthomonadaceae bacterium]